MNTHFSPLVVLLGFLAGLGLFVVLYNQRPYPFLRIIQEYILETFEDAVFLCSLDSRLPIAYWSDATSRGTFSNPQRIYFQLRYSFSIKEFEKMFAKLFHLTRFFGVNRLKLLNITYVTQQHVMYKIRRCEGKRKIEYLVTIKQVKDKKTSTSLHVLSIAWKARH